MSFLKKLFGGKPSPEPQKPVWDGSNFIYVVLPEGIMPLDRSERYEDAIERVLTGGLGEVSGGGSLLNKDGSIDFVGIDIDTPQVERVRGLLRDLLPGLGCPDMTRLQYREGGQPFEDVFADEHWLLARPRTDLHPGFGV